jgi:hypothetical protein
MKNYIQKRNLHEIKLKSKRVKRHLKYVIVKWLQNLKIYIIVLKIQIKR